MLGNYIRIAFRNLGKGKITNAINIIGLSLSMTAALLIALWVQNELSFDSYHTHASRIMRPTIHFSRTSATEQSTLLLGDLAKEQIPGIERVTRLYTGYPATTLQINGQVFKEKNCMYADSNWFSVFDYEFTKGNPASFNSQPYTLVLTEPMAKKYFGNTDPIGKFIRMDTINYEVQGVVKENPANSSFQINMFIPLAARLANPKTLEHDRRWENFIFLTYLQLRPGADTARVAAQLTRILQTNREGDKSVVSLVPLTAVHFEEGVTSRFVEHTNKSIVYIFEVLAGLLLLIACINYVNLTTARAGARVKEVSIKKIVGADKFHLFMQFMIETTVVSLIALSITCIFIYGSLPLFNRFTEKHFVLQASSPVLWKIIGGTLLTAILLNGIYPALLLSSFKPVNIFRGVNLFRIKDASLRKGLVVIQFAISFVLIVGAVTIYKQLQFIQRKDVGYNRDQVIAVELPYTAFKKYPREALGSVQAAIKNELERQPGITAVSNTSESIVKVENGHSGSLDWDGRDAGFRPAITEFLIDDDLPSLLQLKLTEGRWFQPGNIADQKNYILNETAIREFNIRKPVIGQRFTIHGDTGRIIGIAKDFHFNSMHEKIGPLLIYNASEYRSTYLIKTTATQVPKALAAAGTVMKQFLPDSPFDYTFLDEQFSLLYKSEQKISWLMVIFAGIAILVSCLGLLGLAIFTAEQRTKEIGIRKVLGATLNHLILLLSKDFVWLVIVGVLIATPVAWWAMNRWLEDFAYRTPFNAWIFVLAGLFALFIAVITVSFQAIKTATANPVTALRNE